MTAVRTAILLTVLLLLAACSGGGASDTAGGIETAMDEAATQEKSAVSLGGEAAPQPAQGDADAAEQPAEDGAGVDAPKLEPLPDSSLQGQRIIKEGSITIEVAEAKFDTAFQQVIAKARALGGDVVGSSTRTTDDGSTYGSVTVRVPVEDFEDLLVDMGGIGTIRNRDITSQDVSTEFTDLESRLRHLEGLERFYLGLFEEAEGVQDAITVQQKLGDVQGQIEKAQGRLNLLEDRTSFSTLSIEIFEPGAAGPVVQDNQDPSDRPTLAHYWETARDAFVNVVGAMLVVVLFLLPLLVPLALLGAGLLALRRSRGAHAPVTEAPAEREEERVPADV